MQPIFNRLPPVAQSAILVRTVRNLLEKKGRRELAQSVLAVTLQDFRFTLVVDSPIAHSEIRLSSTDILEVLVNMAKLPKESTLKIRLWSKSELG